MYEAEKTLFAAALTEAIVDEIDMMLEKHPEPFACSREHTRRIHHIMKHGTLPSRRRLSKRAWIAIIAATLLLTGCAIAAAREQIAGFFLTSQKENGVNIISTPATDLEQYPTAIEEKKIPRMVPTGYQLVDEKTFDNRLILIWDNGHGGHLTYIQTVHDNFNMGLDNEQSHFAEKEICGYRVLCVTSNDGLYKYVWMDDYIYYISSTHEFTLPEIENIIQNIK